MMKITKKLLAPFFIILSLALFAISNGYRKNAPFLSVVGFVKMADGLGRQCPDLIDALYEDFEIGFYPLVESHLDDVPERILPVIKNPSKALGRVVFFNDQPWRPSKTAVPHGAQRVFDKPKHTQQLRICYTMIESSQIPEGWVETLNTYFDLVAVPDIFLEKVFKDSGVTIPIFILPLGLNLDAYLSRPLKTHFHTPFRFACLGSLGDRKNQLKLVQAFDLAFGKNPDVELLIHARYCERYTEGSMRTLLGSLDNPMIKFQTSRLDEKQYFDLFHTVDMLVNVSKGEGFSIQPRQALALGIPVLVSNNTAQASIVKEAQVASVETPYLSPAYYNYLRSHAGHSFDCDIEHLVEALKKAYRDKDKLLSHGAVNRAYAAQYDYRHIKTKYKNLIAPKKVELGASNRITEEGLVTDSQELREKYVRLLGVRP